MVQKNNIMVVLHSMEVFDSCGNLFVRLITRQMLLIMHLIKYLHYQWIMLSSRQKSIISFVVEYTPTLPKIGLIISKNWDSLQLSQKDSVEKREGA